MKNKKALILALSAGIIASGGITEAQAAATNNDSAENKVEDQTTNPTTGEMFKPVEEQPTGVDTDKEDETTTLAEGATGSEEEKQVDPFPATTTEEDPAEKANDGQGGSDVVLEPVEDTTEKNEEGAAESGEDNLDPNAEETGSVQEYEGERTPSKETVWVEKNTESNVLENADWILDEAALDRIDKEIFDKVDTYEVIDKRTNPDSNFVNIKRNANEALNNKEAREIIEKQLIKTIDKNYHRFNDNQKLNADKLKNIIDNESLENTENRKILLDHIDNNAKFYKERGLIDYIKTDYHYVEIEETDDTKPIGYRKIEEEGVLGFDKYLVTEEIGSTFWKVGDFFTSEEIRELRNSGNYRLLDIRKGDSHLDSLDEDTKNKVFKDGIIKPKYKFFDAIGPDGAKNATAATEAITEFSREAVAKKIVIGTKNPEEWNDTLGGEDLIARSDKGYAISENSKIYASADNKDLDATVDDIQFLSSEEVEEKLKEISDEQVNNNPSPEEGNGEGKEDPENNDGKESQPTEDEGDGEPNPVDPENPDPTDDTEDSGTGNGGEDNTDPSPEEGNGEDQPGPGKTDGEENVDDKDDSTDDNNGSKEDETKDPAEGEGGTGQDGDDTTDPETPGPTDDTEDSGAGNGGEDNTDPSPDEGNGEGQPNPVDPENPDPTDDTEDAGTGNDGEDNRDPAPEEENGEGKEDPENNDGKENQPTEGEGEGEPNPVDPENPDPTDDTENQGTGNDGEDNKDPAPGEGNEEGQPDPEKTNGEENVDDKDDSTVDNNGPSGDETKDPSEGEGGTGQEGEVTKNPENPDPTDDTEGNGEGKEDPENNDGEEKQSTEGEGEGEPNPEDPENPDPTDDTEDPGTGNGGEENPDPSPGEGNEEDQPDPGKTDGEENVDDKDDSTDNNNGSKEDETKDPAEGEGGTDQDGDDTTDPETPNPTDDTEDSGTGNGGEENPDPSPGEGNEEGQPDPEKTDGEENVDDKDHSTDDNNGSKEDENKDPAEGEGGIGQDGDDTTDPETPGPTDDSKDQGSGDGGDDSEEDPNKSDGETDNTEENPTEGDVETEDDKPTDGEVSEEDSNNSDEDSDNTEENPSEGDDKTDDNTDPTTPDPVDENKPAVDDEYKQIFLSNMLTLSALTDEEKADFEKRMNESKSNAEVYAIYNEAVELNKSKKDQNKGNNTNPTTPGEGKDDSNKPAEDTELAARKRELQESVNKLTSLTDEEKKAYVLGIQRADDIADVLGIYADAIRLNDLKTKSPSTPIKPNNPADDDSINASTRRQFQNYILDLAHLTNDEKRDYVLAIQNAKTYSDALASYNQAVNLNMARNRYPEPNEYFNALEYFRKLYMENLEKLTRLTEAEIKAYLATLSKAPTEADIYRAYLEALVRNNQRAITSSPAVTVVEKPTYPSIAHTDSSRISQPQLTFNANDLIYVGRGYKHVAEGFYTRASLVTSRKALVRAIERARINAEAAKLLLRITPNITAKYRALLLAQIETAENLKARAEVALAELDNILNRAYITSAYRAR